MPTTSKNSDPWGLNALRRRWSETRAAVLAAKATIQTAGMTRPPRDPVEQAWLKERGLMGPFLEVERPTR